MNDRRLNLLLAIVLLTTAALVYWPGLAGGFIFDDFPNIVTNSAVHAESVTWQSLRTAANAYQPGLYGRPLATVTFALDYAIGGKDAWQFKLTSLLVHLLNTLLVFWLVKRLLVLVKADDARASIIAAATVTLFWAIHPLQVSSVLYVVQRMETLSLTFVLLALIAYVHGRVQQRDGRNGWAWLALSGLLAGIGMLSKETAALFPAHALALELTLLGFEAKSARSRRVLQGLYIAGVVIVLAVLLGWALPKYAAPGAFANRDFTLVERLLTQLRVLPMYLGQMLLPLPSHLVFYYDDYPKSTGLLNPITTLLGGLFLLALLASAWRLRQRMPLVSLGIFWFFAAHLITSSVFNLELVFEHRNYFALLGVMLALADLVRRIPMRDGPALKYVAVGAIAIAFGALTLMRSGSWGNDLHLAMELVSRNPDSPRASSDLATLYADMADGNPNSPFRAMGEAEFERGSLLPNASPLPEQGLILIAASEGRPVKDEWWDRLVHKLKTRPLGPQEAMTVTGLLNQRYKGIVLDDQRLSEACSALLARRRMPAHVYAQYGDFALKYLKDDALADRMFIKAIERNPKDAAYAAQIIGVLMTDGHIRQAQAVIDRALALGVIDRSTSLSPGSAAAR